MSAEPPAASRETVAGFRLGLSRRALLLHLGVAVLLLALHWLLPPYHQGFIARALVLGAYATAYALAFGYGGLLSLGHAMFFGAGVYAAALSLPASGLPLAFLLAVLAGGGMALLAGALALRTAGVAFMIVSLMFSQVFHLFLLVNTEVTGGEEGFPLAREARLVALGSLAFDPADPDTRYLAALALWTATMLIVLFFVRSRHGRVLVAVRENEERAKMLGHDTFRAKLLALVLSGALSGAAGGAYALLFGYAGAGFASVQYSILPLLWALVGGASTVLGPLLGTLVMQYLVDGAGDVLRVWAPDWNVSTLGVVGLSLILIVLFFPRGLLGPLRERFPEWLP
jgi:branched-chain amino acid transport system permease protein